MTAMATDSDRLVDCDQDALELLKRAGQFVTRIIRVDPDAILFLDRNEKPRTAWVKKNPAYPRPMIKVEDGFPAWRSVRFSDEMADEYVDYDGLG